MWILKYTYELEDGTNRCVSTCLKKHQTYSIGRSSKNPLNIKNDKSISRNHISVVWDPEKGLIQVVNQGKLTAAGGKYLKVEESMNFPESSHKRSSILIELGTKPVKVSVIWQDVVWDLPSQFSQFVNVFGNMGVDVAVDTPDSRSTAIIVPDDRRAFAHRCLYGLVNGIATKNPRFLHEAASTLSDATTTFEERWRNLLEDQSYTTIPKGVSGEHKVLFKGCKFYLIGLDDIKANYCQRAIEDAGGESVIVQHVQQMLERHKGESSTGNLIALAAEDFALKGPDVGVKLYSILDVLNAVSNDTIKTLLGGIHPVDEPSNDDAISHEERRIDVGSGMNNQTHPLKHAVAPAEKPPAKRQRLSRRKIKPLDSLMFFAGGDLSPKESQPGTLTQPTESRAASELGSKNSTPGSAVSRVDPAPGNGYSEESFHSIDSTHKSRLECPANHSPGDGRKAAEVDASNHHSIDDARLLEDEQVAAENEGETSRIVGDAAARPVERKKTLQDFRATTDKSDGSVAPKEDLIDVIKDAKNREVKRLKSTLVQVDTNELTEDAINQLGNLAIVQLKDSLIRQHKVENASAPSDRTPQWDGRKNFKNFVKVQPKYKELRMGDSYREGSSDFIRNSAHLLTRQYVPSKAYNKDSSSNRQDFHEFPEVTFRQGSPPKAADVNYSDGETDRFAFTRNSGDGAKPNRLFVVDEDDSQKTSTIETGGPAGSANVFDPNGINTKITEPVPYSPRKRRHASSHKLNGNSYGAKGDDANDDDDDDDDEDEPKFKFSRRLR